MENSSSGMEVAKLNKENIRRTLDGLQDRASSVLLFTLQWKEFEGFLDKRLQELKSREDRLVSLGNATQRRSDEVEIRSREVEERFQMIVAREEEFDLKQKVESEWRSHEMESIRRSSEDLVSFAKSVDDELKCIEGKHDELVLSMGNLNERQFGQLKSMESFIREKLGEIKCKEEEFGVKEKRLQQTYVDGIAGNERREEMLDKLSHERRRQYELKDKNIQEKGVKLQESSEDLVAREEEFAIKQRLEAEILRKRYELEGKRIQEKEKKIEDCFKDIAAREKELVMKESLETERRQSDMVSSRKLVLLANSIDEKMKQLDVKQNELECMARLTEKQLTVLKSLESCIKDKLNETKQEKEQVRLKEKHLRQCSEDLELEGKRHEDCHSELKQKENNVEESFQQLRKHQELLDKKLLDLELRERKLEELSKRHQLQENIAMGAVKPEPVDSLSTKNVAGHSADANIRFYITMDGKNLQIFLNEHCNEHCSLAGEVAVVLQQSSDPAKLVLDAMEGFYPPFLRKGDQAFEGDVARRSCIMLLDQLRVLSPEIKPHVKQKAMKLALTWIAEVRADVTNPLKVLGFLQLLASYSLASSFDTDEICNLLLNIAGRHQAHRILHSLGFDKIQAFILKLVQGKQYLKAIDFIFALELVNEFRPVHLLKEYLEHSKFVAKNIYRMGNRTPAAKIQADNKRISYLKAIVKCIEKHKLESKYSPMKLKNHKILIANLEKQVRADKAKLNNLKKNANSEFCGQNENANGRLGCQKKNVNGESDGLKQTQNIKQTSKDVASTPLCGAIKSEKSIGKKRPLGSMSDGTDADSSVSANPTSSIKKVPLTLPGPGYSLEGYIQQLIEKDRILEAVKHIFQSHMTDKFHPVPLLTNHLESRRNAFKELLKKDDIPTERRITDLNKMIGAIRAVIKCIEVHKLESGFPMDALQREMADLEKRKEEKCCVVQNSVVKDEPQSKLDSKESQQQQGKKDCTVNATATTAAPVTQAAAGPATRTSSAAAPPVTQAAAGPVTPTSSAAAPPVTQSAAGPATPTSSAAAPPVTQSAAGPATPTSSAAAPSAPTSAAIAADATCKTSAPLSTTAAQPQTNGATHRAGPEEQGKKSCNINETAKTTAPVTPAAPTTPSPSARAPAVAPAAAASKTAAPPPSTGDPLKSNGGTHMPGPHHPNKRLRTASSVQHYSLSGHPARNVHPGDWNNGVSPHYSFYVLGRPNLDHQWAHHADPRNSFAQPPYYHWRGPPHGYGY